VPFTQARGYSPKHPAVAAANPLKKVPVLGSVLIKGIPGKSGFVIQTP